MALVMVQGHVFDTLLAPDARANVLYQLQVIVHGSTAPGFLFASGFVAGLPRAPLSLKASLRRARRLLFVLGVGYALHLPYFSFWKTLAASPAETNAFLACNALQVIAVTQLALLALQWTSGLRWTRLAGAMGLALLAAGPWVWASGLSGRLPLALGTYLDAHAGSFFPVFPFSAFVLAGTVAGAALGRQDLRTRRWRALVWGSGLAAGGALLAFVLSGRVDFWTISPGYALIRIGGLLLLLLGVEIAARREVPGIGPLALIGHETLLVYVLHLYFLFGGILRPAPLAAWAGRLGFAATAAVLILMVPVLFAAAWAWHRAKVHAPHGASLVLSFLTTAFLYQFFTSPW